MPVFLFLIICSIFLRGKCPNLACIKKSLSLGFKLLSMSKANRAWSVLLLSRVLISKESSSKQCQNVDTTLGGSASCVFVVFGSIDTHAVSGSIKWMGISRIPFPRSTRGVIVPVILSIVNELFLPVSMSKSMKDVSPCLAAWTEEKRSYLRPSTTVNSKLSMTCPFSR